MVILIIVSTPGPILTRKEMVRPDKDQARTRTWTRSLTIKDLTMLQMKQRTTEGLLIVYMDWLNTVINPLNLIL